MFQFGARAEIVADTSADRQHQADLNDTVRGLSWWTGISLVILLLAAIGEAWGKELLTFDARRFLVIFTTATLMAAAATSVGGLLGFLFGIPRTLQQELPPSSLPPALAASPQSPERVLTGGNWSYRQTVNTDLEQISDWLTKILVGVGLTQLHQLPSQLWQLAGNFPLAGSVPFSMALILNFLICGFFAGYLLTRLFLAGAFYTAENSLLRFQIAKATILSDEGAFEKAAGVYEKALQGITPNTPKAEKRALYEGLIFNFLYDNPPDGFQRAIQHAQRYISEEPGFPSAKIWAYLAAAYGQQYKDESQKGGGPDVLDPIKAKALEAVRKALAIDPKIKALLQMMWNPTDPAKSPGDDDLEVFYEMKEFKDLLA